MTRVISYIDGFNLYFGLRAKGWRKYYWLDLAAMSHALLRPGQTLVHCHYFTARVRAGGQRQNAKRQSTWLDGLATRPDITCHFGPYLPKPQHCNLCGATWTSHEEKMTDVNIASRACPLIPDSQTGRSARETAGNAEIYADKGKLSEKYPRLRRDCLARPRATRAGAASDRRPALDRGSQADRAGGVV